jgi:hypothetical protein
MLYYSNSNTRDDSKERFSKLDAQVSDISRSMAIIVATLESNFGPFSEFHSSNSKASSDGKLGVKEESEKELEKERPSSTPLPNLHSECKRKWTSNLIKVRSMLLS